MLIYTTVSDAKRRLDLWANMSKVLGLMGHKLDRDYSIFGIEIPILR